ncbi:Ppx/GppA family phosphatase [Corynebacterium hindlerae]|uniref:Ppx/GppA phosphatase family protein n=1 Tax=Corynebacterium hindlerae TaxID=699041 RepID=UPI001AD7418B|nr:Ppx/GppA phosphatase family protein [Corynebacterium hindlerae]QTH60622.1 Ppx/GppA family phosphatase [Corynebacterium hindlerae]
MTRIAAVDCGTNSIRLLISDFDGKTFTDVYRGMKIVRLGQGVDATGKIAEDSIVRARIALSEFVEIMKHEQVTALRMVATSATRDAENRQEFLDMTAELLGQVIPGSIAEEISGEEEARLSFQGAVADLGPEAKTVCVVDLGGGSTEFVVGKRDGTILGAHSAQMGCVRLTERIMTSDPATEEEVVQARDYVARQLADVPTHVPIAQADTFVGVAGTFTTISALAQGLEEYDPALIHGSKLRFDASRVLTSSLIGNTSAERAAHPVMHPGRADVIGSGSAVVEGIMDMIEAATPVRTLIISEKDILDGIVAGLV